MVFVGVDFGVLSARKSAYALYLQIDAEGLGSLIYLLHVDVSFYGMVVVILPEPSGR